MKQLDRFSRNVVAVLFLSSSLVSCKKTEDPQPITPGIDQELHDALHAASGGAGASHYILPNSSDYANIPQDPNNPITSAKVELGMLLFHETGIASQGMEPGITVEAWSCASCHHAQAGFQANIPQGIGEGGIGFGSAGEGRVPNPEYPTEHIDVQPLRSPSVLNVAYQDVTLWNGQFGATGPNVGTEAQWTPGTPKEENNRGFAGAETQAIAGLKVHRTLVDVSFCEENPEYETLFMSAFPGLSPEETMTRVNAGLAVAAYERTVLPNQAPFQRWLRGDRGALTESQKRGAVLFFGEANCASCHNGPALANNEFHAIGMGDLNGAGVISTPDAAGAALGRGGFTGNPDDNYKFKVPQLYNLKDSKFYGHGSTVQSVYDMVAYKNAGQPENGNVPTGQLSPHFTPLQLTQEEVVDIANFIENGLYDPNLMRYTPNYLPTGNCFPNNDEQSRLDLGCN